MRLRAVLFDLDGTLADSAPAIAAALSQVRVDRGSTAVSAGEVRPWISLGAEELVRRALGDAASGGDSDLAAFRSVLQALPTPRNSLYPGVPDMLAALAAAGLQLAVVTNKPEALARKLLADLDLAGRFGAVVGGDTAAHSKPHPAPLLAALSTLGARPPEAALVGDSRIDADAAGALSIPFHLFEGGYGAAECEGRATTSRFRAHDDLPALLLPARVAA